MSYRLAGFLGGFGAVLLLGSLPWSLDLTGAFAAVGLADVVLGVVGLAVSTLTAIAGALVLADMWADADAARAWQQIYTELILLGEPAETAPDSRIGARYFGGPQDERLRRVLLAHRFEVPVSPPNSAVECVPAHADAKVACSPNGVDACSEFSATIAHIAAIAPADALANPAVILHHRAPKLIASSANRLDKIGNASEDRRRGHSRGPRTASKIRLVANARPSWDCPGRRKTGSHRPPAGRLVADVIVLADRDGRDQGRAIAEVRAGITAPAQPGCRGPPAAGSHQLRACEPESTRGARGSRHRPRTDAATAPADPTVVDDLGDRVPVGVAELEVVEAYGGDLLRDLLTAVGAGQDGQTS